MSIRVLLLTKKVPFPLRDGESVAINNMVLGLKEQGITVDLLTFNTVKHYTDINQYPSHLGLYGSVESVALDNQVKVIPAFTNLLGSKSYHIERFESEEYAQVLRQLLSDNTYDIVQLESIFLGPYISTIREYSDARVVLRTHNVEAVIWKRLSIDAALPKRQYLSIQAARLESYESMVINEVDRVLPMSEADASVLRKMGMNVEHTTIPISLDISNYTHKIEDKRPHSICFIGSLDWRPNTQGLMWFVEHVWPLIRRHSPNISFHVAGRNASAKLESTLVQAGVDFCGEVPNAIDFIAQHDAMVVPLLSGSGQRVKILESLAIRIPVVATTIGAEGIAVEDKSSIILADDPDLFARQVCELLSNERLRDKIAAAGFSLIQERYSTQSMGQVYRSVYEEML